MPAITAPAIVRRATAAIPARGAAVAIILRGATKAVGRGNCFGASAAITAVLPKACLECILPIAMQEFENNQPSSRWSKARASLGAVGLVVLEVIKVIVIAGVTIVAVRYYLFKPFYVKGASMEPNFNDHEYLIIDELSYRWRAPQRGEVIVFRYPENPKEYFLKRIIAIPGERVKVGNGRLTVYNTAHPEGVEITEPYLDTQILTLGEKTTRLDENQYFVLGDNRMNSYDSRRFGPIDKSAIVGRAWFRGWPISRVQTFSPPQYTF